MTMRNGNFCASQRCILILADRSDNNVEMKIHIILVPIAIIVCSCSTSKQTKEVVEKTEPTEIKTESEIAFEDENMELEFESEPLNEEPESFDINAIEFDTLNLPKVSTHSTIKILTTSQFHADEVWPEAVNQSWIGLFKSDSTSFLKVVHPKFERVKDAILDEGDEVTGWEITTEIEDKCILLITGLNLTEGEIPTIDLHSSMPLPSDTINLNLEESSTRLVVSGLNHEGFLANYKMKLLEPKENKEQIIVAKSNFDDQMINILWAGDIDGDGKVDLIIDTARHYNVMAPSLFLSSQADEKSIVKCVAIHRTLGC